MPQERMIITHEIGVHTSGEVSMHHIPRMQEGHALRNVQCSRQDLCDVWNAAAWASQLALLSEPALVDSFLQSIADRGVMCGKGPQLTACLAGGFPIKQRPAVSSAQWAWAC